MILGRKALAALGAAASENFLATSGQHALTEAVTALANDAARLIRALHGSLRPNKSRFPRAVRAEANNVAFSDV